MTEELSVNKHSLLESAIKAYSKTKKKCKTHRSVLDMNSHDLRIIKNICRSVGSIDKSESKRDIKKR